MTNMIITAYCACQLCCGPDALGITASGREPVQGRTVAINGLKFGTRVHIQGVGWRTVEDRMPRKYNGRVDVYFNRHRDAAKFGLRRAKVWVVK